MEAPRDDLVQIKFKTSMTFSKPSWHTWARVKAAETLLASVTELFTPVS